VKGRFIGSQKGVILRGGHFSKDFLQKRELAIPLFYEIPNLLQDKTQ
jgi:hypothetical protein